MIWLLEPDVFSPEHDQRMTTAVKAEGHSVVLWEDGCLSKGVPAYKSPVVFHGSLGIADGIATECLNWQPGAFCKTEAFRCSAWYPKAARWRLQQQYEVLPASALVANPNRFGTDEIFVRPDSPLKPFSGRVLRTDSITLGDLDYGFYFDDAETPVVVAPVQEVGREWRFVVVDKWIVAGSSYTTETRTASTAVVENAAKNYAARIAQELEPPERVYVLDVCETNQGLRLLEVNPFSGADLYGCDLTAVVRAVSKVAEQGLTASETGLTLRA